MRRLVNFPWIDTVKQYAYGAARKATRRGWPQSDVADLAQEIFATVLTLLRETWLTNRRPGSSEVLDFNEVEDWDEEVLRTAKRKGASRTIDKELYHRDQCGPISEVIDHHLYDPQISVAVREGIRAAIAAMSPMERRVWRCRCRGQTLREIAATLSLSKDTARRGLEEIYRRIRRHLDGDDISRCPTLVHELLHAVG